MTRSLFGILVIVSVIKVYKNGKCRNKLVDNLFEECSENIDGKNAS